MRRRDKERDFSPFRLFGGFTRSRDNPVTLSRIVDVSPTRSDRWHREATMRSMTRTISPLHSFTDPETVTGRLPSGPGCVRSLTRSAPDNAGDRSDPIPDNSASACHSAARRRPQTTGALRQVPISMERPDRDFFVSPSACGHAINTGLEDTCGTCLSDAMTAIVSRPGDRRVRTACVAYGSFTPSPRKRSWISSSA